MHIEAFKLNCYILKGLGKGKEQQKQPSPQQQWQQQQHLGLLRECPQGSWHPCFISKVKVHDNDMIPPGVEPRLSRPQRDVLTTRR